MPKSKLKGDLVSFACPACRSTLKVRAAYAHLRGRCPECGVRIEPPRPKPADAKPVRAADGEIGLEPIEEEWPEPAQVETEADDGLYAMEPVAPKTPAAVPVADHGPPPAGPAGGEDDPYAVMAPVGHAPPREAPIIYRLSEAELNPLRAPPPPPFPLVQGIYLFPWRPDNFLTWLVLAAEFALLTALACGIRGCWVLLQEGSFMGGFIVPLIAVACVAGLWVGSYAAVQFLTAIEETAAGNDRYPRPEWTMWEGISRLFYLLGMAGLCAIPGVFLGGLAAALLPSPAYAWLVPPAVGALFFPIFLLSSMATNAVWKVLDRQVIGPLLAKPQALAALYVPSWLMLGLCLYLAFETVVRARLALLPLTGAALAACLLIYGRLLGRVAWYITLRKVKGKGRKKKRAAEEAAANE